MDYEQESFGIVYRKKTIQKDGKNDLYILIPYKLVRGYDSIDDFYVDGTTSYKMTRDVKSLRSTDYLVGGIASPEALMDHYDAWEVDIKDISDLYFLEECDYVTFAFIKDDKVKYKKIKKEDIKNLSDVQIVNLLEEDRSVILSETNIEYFLRCDNIDDIKEGLTKLKGLINETSRYSDKLDGMKVVYDKDGKLDRTEVLPKDGVSLPEVISNSTSSKVVTSSNSDISLLGLEQYLKERVFGHDKEIERISTILIMNSMAKEGDIIKSILIPGPTGSGKTLTFETACEYMNMPYVIVNSPNLVPQGIVGYSLEDALYSLICKCNGDISKASKGLLFFDEFDKLGNNNSDQKESVVQIMLMLMSGAEFSFEKERKTYSINTRYISKMYAGAFSELFSKKNKPIGFGSSVEKESTFNKSKLYEYGNLDKQLVDRIEFVIPYDALSREDRKRALLSSKASALLREADRLKREFGIDIRGYEDYADGIIEALERDAISSRDVNNLVLESFLPIERELLLSNGNVSRLVLSRDTVSSNKFDLC